MCVQCHECDPRCFRASDRCHLRLVVLSVGFSIQHSALYYFYQFFTQARELVQITCLYFVSVLFLLKQKKLQKRERTCRAYMKVLKQSFCPLCLQLLSPLFLYYRTVYALAQVQQHAPSPLSCTPSSLCFLLFWVIASHKNTVVFKVLPKSKRSHLQLLRWLLFVTVYVSSFFFSPVCIDSYGVFCCFFRLSLLLFSVFTQDCTPTWITAQLKQTSSSYIPLIIHLMKDMLLCSDASKPFLRIISWPFTACKGRIHKGAGLRSLNECVS